MLKIPANRAFELSGKAGQMAQTDEFPAGLIQPQGCARFSLDALLLASFAARNVPEKIASRRFLAMEAGSGCGAALLGFARLLPNAACLGFDSESILADAANRNAASLSLAGRCQFITADAAYPARDLAAWQGKADIFFCNPPWRDAQKGIVTKIPLRQKAHWQTENTLAAFLQAAEFCMRRHAALCLILPVASLPGLFGFLTRARLGLRRLLPVTSFAGMPAKRLLCLCKKDAANDFELLAPLAIHVRSGSQIHYSAEAQEFCPWLGNPAE